MNRTIIESLERLLVEALLPPEAQRQFAEGAVSHANLKPYADAVARLSARYVSREAIVPLSPAEAVAYALYYTPVNAAKILHLLSRIPPKLFNTPEIRILDYGCGPGTASLAASFLLTAPSLAAVDNAPAMRSVAARLLGARANGCPITWSVSDSFAGKFDLIFAANVLNELSPQAALTLLERLLDALSPDGALITLEPALLNTTRNHMALRDAVLAGHPDLNPLFPCTHRARCPMLPGEPTEWCHTDLMWEEPRLIRQIDELTGFNKHRPKFSAFIFTRASSIPPGIRIVRAVEKSKRGASAIGCSGDFFGELTLLKRFRTEGNRLFQKLGSYDRITIEPPLTNGDIPASATVRLLESTGDRSLEDGDTN